MSSPARTAGFRHRQHIVRRFTRLSYGQSSKPCGTERVWQAGNCGLDLAFKLREGLSPLQWYGKEVIDGRSIRNDDFFEKLRSCLGKDNFVLILSGAVNSGFSFLRC